MSALPDAAPGNWVDRIAPAPLRPWLRLARLDRPTGVWLLMLPGWQGIALADARRGRAPDLGLLAIFLAGAALMRAAGCAWNDAVDRDLDAKVARTAARPVASGQISRRGALIFALACTLASAALLLALSLACLWLAIASLALVAAYPFMKRITWWPQAWLGLTFNWGALMGYAAVAGGLAPPTLVLYAAGVCWTLGYDTIYAVQDLEDDALAGVRSSARRLGRAAPAAVFVFYVGATALASTAAALARLGPVAFMLIAVFGVSLLRQPRRLWLDDPAGALVLFKSNALSGLILFAALALGAWRG